MCSAIEIETSLTSTNAVAVKMIVASKSMTVEQKQTSASVLIVIVLRLDTEAVAKFVVLVFWETRWAFKHDAILKFVAGLEEFQRELFVIPIKTTGTYKHRFNYCTGPRG